MSDAPNKNLRRWLYAGKRPNWIAKAANWLTTLLTSSGLTFGYAMITLEVVGRKSGKPISMPLVMPTVDDNRYLVSMLGQDVNWVLNVRAAGGDAVIVSGGREDVRLVDVPVAERAPILKAYIKAAPGARAHMSPLTTESSLADFEAAAARFPTFRVEPRG